MFPFKLSNTQIKDLEAEIINDKINKLSALWRRLVKQSNTIYTNVSWSNTSGIRTMRHDMCVHDKSQVEIINNKINKLSASWRVVKQSQTIKYYTNEAKHVKMYEIQRSSNTAPINRCNRKGKKLPYIINIAKKCM